MATSKITDFERLHLLGKGSFGMVYSVKRKVDQRVYVMKQIPIADMTEKEQRDAIREVQIMAALDSDYVVRYYDSFIDGGQLNIIMEYCPGGDLHQLLMSRDGKLPTENEVWKWFIQICLGLHHLHSRSVLHRDLKTMNLFLDQQNNIKIGDMGVARVLGSTRYAHTLVGTPYYLSPELCQDKPYNDKSDVWALGCVLYELCTLKHPFDANNQGALILKIIRGRYPPLPKSAPFSANINRLLQACLRKSTSKRPSILQLLCSQNVYMKTAELGVAVPAEVRTAIEAFRSEAAERGQTKAKRRVSKNKGKESAWEVQKEREKEREKKRKTLVAALPRPTTSKKDGDSAAAVPVTERGRAGSKERRGSDHPNLQLNGKTLMLNDDKERGERERLPSAGGSPSPQSPPSSASSASPKARARSMSGDKDREHVLHHPLPSLVSPKHAGRSPPSPKMHVHQLQFPPAGNAENGQAPPGISHPPHKGAPAVANPARVRVSQARRKQRVMMSADGKQKMKRKGKKKKGRRKESRDSPALAQAAAQTEALAAEVGQQSSTALVSSPAPPHPVPHQSNPSDQFEFSSVFPNAPTSTSVFDLDLSSPTARVERSDSGISSRPGSATVSQSVGHNTLLAALSGPASSSASSGHKPTGAKPRAGDLHSLHSDLPFEHSFHTPPLPPSSSSLSSTHARVASTGAHGLNSSRKPASSGPASLSPRPPLESSMRTVSPVSALSSSNDSLSLSRTHSPAQSSSSLSPSSSSSSSSSSEAAVADLALLRSIAKMTLKDRERTPPLPAQQQQDPLLNTANFMTAGISDFVSSAPIDSARGHPRHSPDGSADFDNEVHWALDSADHDHTSRSPSTHLTTTHSRQASATSATSQHTNGTPRSDNDAEYSEYEDDGEEEEEDGEEDDDYSDYDSHESSPSPSHHRDPSNKSDEPQYEADWVSDEAQQTPASGRNKPNTNMQTVVDNRGRGTATMRPRTPSPVHARDAAHISSSSVPAPPATASTDLSGESADYEYADDFELGSDDEGGEGDDEEDEGEESKSWDDDEEDGETQSRAARRAETLLNGIAVLRELCLHHPPTQRGSSLSPALLDRLLAYYRAVSDSADQKQPSPSSAGVNSSSGSKSGGPGSKAQDEAEMQAITRSLPPEVNNALWKILAMEAKLELYRDKP